MLTAVIFSLDATLADALRELMGQSRQIRLDKSITRAVQNYEAVRVVNTLDPDLVFLDFSDPVGAADLALAISTNAPRAALLGIGSKDGVPEDVVELVQGWLETPLAFSEVEPGAVNAVRRHAGSMDQPFFTFLPAKAGCGSTTAALHVADALSNELGHSTLLVDADLRSGVIAVLLNVDPPRSLRDALASTADLQPSAWHNLVVRVEKLDVLASRPDQTGPLPLWTDYFKLVQFAGPRYEAVIADLPELVNDATFELARRSRRVFVVTTAELVALRLASQRLHDLENSGIAGDRVSIVLNRWHKSDLSVDEVARFLKKPVVAVLPNDYRTVQKAALAGGIVNPETPLGKAYVEFARRLWEGKDAEPARPPQVAGGVKALLGLHR
jgi:Flp pilus assembly CpaE family ATPase